MPMFYIIQKLERTRSYNMLWFIQLYWSACQNEWMRTAYKKHVPLFLMRSNKKECRCIWFGCTTLKIGIIILVNRLPCGKCPGMGWPRGMMPRNFMTSTTVSMTMAEKRLGVLKQCLIAWDTSKQSSWNMNGGDIVEKTDLWRTPPKT